MPDSLIKEISTIAASLGLGGLITLVVGRLMGKKKEEIDIAFTESKIYRELIAELKSDRDERIAKEIIREERIEALKNEVHELTLKVQLFIKQDSEQKKNLLKWENYCERLKGINEEQKKQINILFNEIEEYEKRN
jgi:hypothetical protein